MDPNYNGDRKRHFPEILYEMVNDPSTDSIISWSQSGKSFIVWNESEFCGDVLPRFLLLTRFSSFITMLDRFSFRKVEEESDHHHHHQLEFANDSFVRCKPELAKLQNFVMTTPPALLDAMERRKKRVFDLVLRDEKEKEKEKENVVYTISRCITQCSISSVRDYSNSIPNDLLIDIFSRAPVKSVGRFRCLSKFWASTLHCSDFTELFLTNSLARPRFLFIIKANEELFVFSALQPQNPDDNSALVATGYKYLPRYFPTEIRSSLCGLVFLHNTLRGNMRVICNPATGESITLPRLKAKGLNDSYFGFDPIKKQFKVLCMTWSYVEYDLVPNTNWILTLETGKRLWRTIQHPIFPHIPTDEGEICINGVLYYEVYFEGSSMIVCFDFRSEKFVFVNIDEDMSPRNLGILFNYKGKLGATDFRCGNQKKGEIVLWVLEDAGKHRWFKIIFALPPFWYKTLHWTYKFAGMTGTGEIVFSRRRLSKLFYLFYYNVERMSFTRVSVTGFEEFNHHRTNISTFLDYVENMKLM